MNPMSQCTSESRPTYVINSGRICLVPKLTKIEADGSSRQDLRKTKFKTGINCIAI